MTPERIARYREIKDRCDAVGLLSAGAVIAELVEEVLALEADREKLHEWEEDYREIMKERRNDDRVHCSCVPDLRRRIRELQAEVERLKANPSVSTGTQPINKGGFSKTNPWPHTWTENQPAPGSNAGPPPPLKWTMKEQSCGNCLWCEAGDNDNAESREWNCCWMPDVPFWLDILNIPDRYLVTCGPKVWETGKKCEAWEPNP